MTTGSMCITWLQDTLRPGDARQLAHPKAAMLKKMDPPHVWTGLWVSPKSTCEELSFPNQKLQIPPNAGNPKAGNPNAVRFIDHDSDFVLPLGCEAHGLVSPRMETQQW